MSLGKLENCPYLYHDYICCRCKNTFSFLGGLRCDCENNNKYRNKPVFVNGERFDGFREAKYCNKLSFLNSKQVVINLKFHPKWYFRHNGVLIATYSADAEYEYNGKKEVIDVKGKETQVFRLKKKMMKAFYPDINLYLIK